MAALTMALAGGMTSCSDPLGPEQSEFDRARARWEGHAPVLYAFRFQRSCFCPRPLVRPVEITVADGMVISAVDPATSEPLDPPPDGFPTIDDLFDEIQDAIDRDADAVDVAYDEALGYPVQVFIDWIRNAIDDEMSFQVSEYVEASPLVPIAPSLHAQLSQPAHSGAGSPK